MRKGRQEVMKKKVLTLMLVLGLAAAQPLTAGATVPSGTTEVTVSTEDNSDYAVAPESEQFTGERAPQEAVLEKIEEFNGNAIDLDSLVEIAGAAGTSQTAEQTEELKEALAGMTPLIGVFDAYPINGGRPEADGSHRLSFHLPNLTRAVRNVYFLHYSMVRGIWEMIAAEVDYENKMVTGRFPDLSPVVIVAEVDNSADTGSDSGGSGSSSGGGSGSGAGSSSSADTAQSPKTGETLEWVKWIGAAAVLGTAAVLVKRPKKSAR